MPQSIIVLFVSLPKAMDKEHLLHSSNGIYIFLAAMCCKSSFTVSSSRNYETWTPPQTYVYEVIRPARRGNVGQHGENLVIVLVDLPCRFWGESFATDLLQPKQLGLWTLHFFMPSQLDVSCIITTDICGMHAETLWSSSGVMGQLGLWPAHL